MSKIHDNAEAIKQRLTKAPLPEELKTAIDLTKVDVVTDWQKKIKSKVDTALAKATGTAIVITWTGFVTLDPKAKRPRLAHSYNIAVWSKPVIAGDELAADDVVESIIARLWQWSPGNGHALNECEVRNGGMVEDTRYLINDCDVIIPTNH